MSILYGLIAGIVVLASLLWRFHSDSPAGLPFPASSPESAGTPGVATSRVDPFIKPFLRRFSGKKNAPGSGHIRFLMAQAGDSGMDSTLEFIGLMNCSTALGAALLVTIATAVHLHPGLIIMAGFGGAIVGRIIPRQRLQWRIEKRQVLISAQLPEVVDFLTAEVEGGASFDDACHKLTKGMSGPLPEYFTTIYQRISLGVPRWEAFVDMMDVINNSDMRSLVEALVSVEFKGERLGETLRRQGEKMRGIQPPPTREEIEKTLSRLSWSVYHRLLDDMPSAIMNESNLERKRGMLRDLATQVSAEEAAKISFALPESDREKLIRGLLDDMLGYGPLQVLLDDAEITHIMVNGPFAVFHEKRGRLETSPVRFLDNADLMRIVERLVHPVGKEITIFCPYATSRLPDGSSVHAVIPPLCLNGPSLLIQKRLAAPTPPATSSGTLASSGFPICSTAAPITLAGPLRDLIDFGTLSAEMGGFLLSCVQGRCNMIVTGEAESGKTTFLNVLGSLIAPERRVLVVEEKAELELRQPNVLRLAPCAGNTEGRGKIDASGVLVISREFRPDYTLFGECRGAEFAELLAGMASGPAGVMTTCRTAPDTNPCGHFETLLQSATPASPAAPRAEMRRQIVGAIRLIIRLARFPDGSRKVTHMTEIQGMKDGEILQNDLFRFVATGADEAGKVVGTHQKTGEP
jgi:pilus assembly protein CpaF